MFFQEHLKSTYFKLKSIQKRNLESITNESTVDLNVTDESDPFEKYLSELVGSNNSTFTNAGHTIDQKLINLAYGGHLKSSTNVLQYYEHKKFEDTDIYELSQVVLAVPTAQVSVERAFSALGTILSATRTKLSSKSLEDILIVRQNSEYLEN